MNNNFSLIAYSPFAQHKFAVVIRGLYQLAILLLALLAGAGCNEEIDLERPTATILSPSNGATITTAQGIVLSALFEDNGELLQYKVLLEGIDSLNGIMKDTTLRWIRIEGLSGASFNLNEIIALPDSTFNGFYRLLLSCIDSEGNQAYNDTVVVRVVNSLDSIAPVITVNGPVVGDTLGIGQGFWLGGMVTDEAALNRVTVFVGRINRSQAIVAVNLEPIVNNAVNLDALGWYFSIDSTWTKGAYEVYFTAWDNHSGASFSIPFHVNY